MFKPVLFFFSIILLSSGISSAQSDKEKWDLISSKGGSRLSINLNGIEENKYGDIYVWALEEHGSPIVIESVPKKISKTKTYYLINKNFKRYSISQLLYYDEKGNVQKHFSYTNESQDTTYRYSYPILPSSNMELILTRCLETIKK